MDGNPRLETPARPSAPRRVGSSLVWLAALGLCSAPAQAQSAEQGQEQDQGQVQAARSGPAPSAGGRPADTPLSVEVVEVSPPGADEAAGQGPQASGGEGDLSQETGRRGAEGPAAERAEGPPPPRLDPREVPIQVAVGLGPSAPGSREELALVDALEGAVAGSSAPPTVVRRLQGGAGEARSVCRQRRDDLVITVAYVAEWEEPVLLAYDCALERALGTRAATAASEVGLVAALWAEHEELLLRGVKERRAPLLSRRTRRIVIAGGAITALGVALGVILASTLRPQSVVLTVGP